MTSGTDLRLYGYEHSVYVRAVRLVLAEKKLSHHFEHIDPFDPDKSKACLARHPFGRVPSLNHGGFELYETSAIQRYLDVAFPQQPLTPACAKSVGRTVQVACITDAYGYWPMVRQVFAHRIFRPREGLETDEREITEGLVKAKPVLAALNEIAEEGRVLDGVTVTLADCHLAPMIAAFTSAPEGAEMLTGYPALAGWWTAWATRPSMQHTNTGFDRLDRQRA
ncbi:glutathione S-transferase family protein [Roseobacter weihaiensis]|uniref:glutathione S-transferase family protein n=1 Tax=Roseobacter weihaiensis TaxID=2763262 RepID=UPI001D0AAE4F|nr:glutathione S-transferase family protein [Roseobacter sp. H9]